MARGAFSAERHGPKGVGLCRGREQNGARNAEPSLECGGPCRDGSVYFGLPLTETGCGFLGWAVWGQPAEFAPLPAGSMTPTPVCDGGGG